MTERKFGRPSLGTTKKLSLTLTDDEWRKLELKAFDNKSEYLRNLVRADLMNLDSEFFYFKNKQHEEFFKRITGALKYKDSYYISFSYVASAIGKEELVEVIEVEKIDLDIFYEIMKVWSPAEQTMLKFALQCFNNSYSNLSFEDVIHCLDDNNLNVVRQALKIRYNF